MAQVNTNKQLLPAGGGNYALTDLTLGIFLTDQPNHRTAAGNDGSKLLPLLKHQGWILPAGSEGRCEHDQDLELLTVSIDGKLLREVGMSAEPGFENKFGDFDPILLNLCLGAESFVRGGTIYRETMHRALAVQIASTINPLPDWLVDIDDKRLRRVIDYIHDSLHEDLTLACMSDLAAMSATRFSRAFKSATGSSPLQYVIGARLDKAATCLRTTELTVAEIAWKVGYRDLSRFGQHFKRRFKVTPARFRTSI